MLKRCIFTEIPVWRSLCRDTYSIFRSFSVYTVGTPYYCYSQNLSGSLELDFWWGLSALSACTKHQQHVPLARVPHPSFASESPSRQTPLSEILQMRNNSFLNPPHEFERLEEIVLFWHALTNGWWKISCTAYCTCSVFHSDSAQVFNYDKDWLLQ